MAELCSIITPAYNTAPFIKDTIGSVLAQKHQDWEMIIVDDCSDDGTREIASGEAEKDGRIRLLINKENRGQAAARNAAIRAAKGRYIAFLDSDDLWAPEKLSKQIAFMREKKSPLSYTAYRKIDESGNILGDLPVPGKAGYGSLLYTNCIGCLTAVYDVGRLGKQYFPTFLTKHEDYMLWLKILKKMKTAHGLDEPLAFYRVRQNSVSRNKMKAAHYQWKIYRDAEGLPLHKSAFYLLHYAFHGLKKSF